MATITKRGRRWTVKIRRKGYPQKTKSFLLKADAESWARKEELAIDRGEWRDRSGAQNTTLHSLLSRYLTDVVPQQRGGDIAALRVNTLMRDDLAQYKLAALSPLVVADWRDARLAAGAAGSTVNRELNILSAVLNWGRRELMIAMENPVASIRRPKNPPSRDRRLEPEEEVALMAALEDHSGALERSDGKGYRHGTRNRYVRPLVQLALETAMRRGELLSLRWEYVDLEHQVARLLHTKNGQPRNVPLSKAAVALLRDLEKRRDEEREAREQERGNVSPLRPGDEAEADSDDRVFPITPNALKMAWNRATERAGLEDLHFHDLRHEATSRLAEKVPNVIELAAITGHRTLDMLRRYYHPRAHDLAKKLG